MAAKTKEPKPKVLNKAEKAAKKMAYNDGRSSRDMGTPRHDCPHESEGHLRDGWLEGWDEADATEQSVAEANVETDATTVSVIVNGQEVPLGSDAANAHIFGAIETAIERDNGHNFNDPTVLERYETLALMMKAFDDIGVQIVEEQWRALSDAEQNIAARWLNQRRTGATTTCPEFLKPFASAALKAEFTDYLKDQRSYRRVVMPCKFGKHSETKPDGDDCEPKIKMTLLVPVADLSAATANDLWGWARDKIEFSRRSVNTWDQAELPGSSQTFTCVADVSGFSRNRTHWKFGFFINMTELSIEDAYTLWKESGSCRIERIGEPVDESKRDEAENPEADEDDDEPDEVRQPLLFDPENQADGDLSDTPQDEPDQYLVPITYANASCALSVWQIKGRYFASSDLVFDWPEADGDSGTDAQYGEGEMYVPTGDGSVSLQAAIESELGTLIEEIVEDDAPKELVNELKDELNRISKGGSPHTIPKSDAAAN